MDFKRKLALLADAAKYDASCASSGAKKRDSLDSAGIGSASSVGICHSYTPDGRCISLLKLLMTNVCIYDCHFCINRRSSDTKRARMSVREIVQLTLDFYKRNYIEGLFLSSGIIRNADYTMELVVRVAQELREKHEFKGYIHLKTIPEASPELIERASAYADRISINIELPSEVNLRRLAPEKSLKRTQNAMGVIHSFIQKETDEQKVTQRLRRPNRNLGSSASAMATGQSTQMIVGADDSTDSEILNKSNTLYQQYKLKRVYFSAFSPIQSSSTMLPLKSPPLMREHRLYQADWLMRFYGYQVGELVDSSSEGQAINCNLDLDLDPKLAWALRNRCVFPVDINTAPREILLRVPGIGVRSVMRILSIRRYTRITLTDLIKLRVSLKKSLPFIVAADHSPKRYELDSSKLKQQFTSRHKQTEFAFVSADSSARHGEI